MEVWIAVALNVLAAIVAAWRCGTWMNPFSVAQGLFAASGFIFLKNPLIPSFNWTSEISPETEKFILIASISLAVVTFTINRRKWTLPTVPPYRAGALRLVIVVCFGEVLLHTAALLAKNGGSLPIWLMSESYSMGRGATYDEFLIPFLTSLTWGVCRLMAVLLCLDFLMRGGRILDHVARFPLEYGLTALANIMTLGAGLRNVIVWPVAFFLFGLARKGAITRRNVIWTGLVSVAMAVAFIMVGNLRTGGSLLVDSPVSSMLDLEIRNPLLKSMTAWFVLYTGTGYLNLNAMIVAPPELSHGWILIGQIVPDALIETLVKPTQSAIDHLVEGDLLPYFGFTFRTIYVDLYADFGFWGSLIAGAIVYAASIYAFNRTGETAGWTAVFLCILPGILMFPFINFYTGLPTLAPLGGSLLFLHLAGAEGGVRQRVRNGAKAAGATVRRPGGVALPSA